MNDNHQNLADVDQGDDLKIKKTTRQAGGNGTWVLGAIADHRFQRPGLSSTRR